MSENLNFQIADLLEECISGEKDPNTVLGSIRSYEQLNDTLINEAIHFMHHYSADEDIRARDKEYEKGQKEKLMEFVRLLREAVIDQ